MPEKTEKLPDPERATSAQAQTVLDEIDRITENVRLLPGIKTIKNLSAPTKTRWHRGMLFNRHPEGQRHTDDPDSINLAGVAWDNPDGSRTAYRVELTLESGLQLTTHTYAPIDPQLEARMAVSAEAMAAGDYATVTKNAAADLADALKSQKARKEERALGLHIASFSEAATLITQLQGVDPARA